MPASKTKDYLPWRLNFKEYWNLTEPVRHKLLLDYFVECGIISPLESSNLLTKDIIVKLLRADIFQKSRSLDGAAAQERKKLHFLRRCILAEELHLCYGISHDKILDSLVKHSSSAAKETARNNEITKITGNSNHWSLPYTPVSGKSQMKKHATNALKRTSASQKNHHIQNLKPYTALVSEVNHHSMSVPSSELSQECENVLRPLTTNEIKGRGSSNLQNKLKDDRNNNPRRVSDISLSQAADNHIENDYVRSMNCRTCCGSSTDGTIEALSTPVHSLSGELLKNKCFCQRIPNKDIMPETKESNSSCTILSTIGINIIPLDTDDSDALSTCPADNISNSPVKLDIASRNHECPKLSEKHRDKSTDEVVHKNDESIYSRSKCRMTNSYFSTPSDMMMLCQECNSSNSQSVIRQYNSLSSPDTSNHLDNNEVLTERFQLQWSKETPKKNSIVIRLQDMQKTLNCS
jgi:hypothetical protein